MDVIRYPSDLQSTVSISFQDHAVFTMISGLPAMATFSNQRIELSNNHEGVHIANVHIIIMKVQLFEDTGTAVCSVLAISS